MADLDRLEQMAEKAAAAWPSLPEWMVEKAMGYVEANQVHPLGHLPVTGIDEWEVAGVHCSHKNQKCQCRERGIVTSLGRVCSHRLAVMFSMRLRDEMFERIRADYAKAGGVERVTLLADVYFSRHGYGKDMWVIKGWRLNGVGTTKLGHDDRIEVDADSLRDLLQSVGWKIVGKQAGTGYEFRLFTERMSDADRKMSPEIATGIGRIFAKSPYAEERAKERERHGYRFEMDLERRNMQEVYA